MNAAGECRGIYLIIVGPGNGAVRQQAITRANGDPDLCRHMVLQDHDE